MSSRIRKPFTLACASPPTANLATNYLGVQDRLKQGLNGKGHLGPRGAVIFIAIYVIATLLFIPGLVLTLGAGAVFSVVWGSIHVSIGSTLGATCAFLVGWYLARNDIALKIQGNAHFAAIDKTAASEGWEIVGLTRLSPVFPFTLLNHPFGKQLRIELPPHRQAGHLNFTPP